MGARRQDVTRSSEPGEERQQRRHIEPGDMRCRSQTATTTMVRDVKRQVQTKRQVDVDCARKKRKHAERESHNKTEQIEIRPGHKTPRNAAPRCADWNSRRRPFGSVV